MSTPRFAVAALLAGVCLLPATRAGAQLVLVEQGFTASTLSGDFAKQVEIGVGPDTCLYYGSNEGLSRRCGYLDPGTICDPGLQFPVGIAFGPGGAFGTQMYVADYSINDIHRAADCGVTTPFATVFSPGSIAFPPVGSAYGDFLYACEAFEGPIYRVSSTGVVTNWLDLTTAYLRFGPGGAWGTGLYATEFMPPFDGRIVRVSSSGAITPLAGEFFAGEGFDWGFDGDMFATDAALGEIYRIQVDGTKTPFATLPGAADVAFRAGEQALYVVSNQGGFYRIVAGTTTDVAATGDPAFRLSVTPNPARGACALHFALPAGGIARAEILDASGRRVRQLGAGWRPAGAQTLSWDGRDNSGSLARPGAYFARVRAAGAALTVRFNVVR
jgi:hypothetical protein